ncbi:porin [Pantoea sp. 18069]|uniref:porin n=1 Tax=Pantoea sp. 18069 TaxID=2681415 RepID=UPI00135A20B8|nr:porin [Pantoea sp. 18069]
MKQKVMNGLLALTTLTLVPAAQAQSQVTLYGIIDTNLEYLSDMPSTGGGASSLVRMGNSGLQGPRLGFRGSEDLGNGLKAIFTLEHGFNSDTGTNADATRFFNRGAFIGLESSNHRLTLGRQYTSLFDGLLYVTPLAYSGAYEPFSPLLGGLRNDNALKYRLKLDGWSAQLHYAFGEQAGASSSNAAWGGNITYGSKNLNVALAYDQQNGLDVAGAHPRARKTALGAAYQLTSGLRLSSGYRWGQNKDAASLVTLRDDFWWLGVNYKTAGALTLSAAYYQQNVKTRNGVGNQPDPKQLTLQAIYALSKRTDLYAALAHAKNAGLNFAALNTLGGNADSQTGLAMGIRHRF